MTYRHTLDFHSQISKTITISENIVKIRNRYIYYCKMHNIKIPGVGVEGGPTLNAFQL